MDENQKYTAIKKLIKTNRNKKEQHSLQTVPQDIAIDWLMAIRKKGKLSLLKVKKHLENFRKSVASLKEMFQTLQSRLPLELRLAGGTTLEQANEFLNSYIKGFNIQFALPVNNIKIHLWKTTGWWKKQLDPCYINQQKSG